jgi:peptidoglycan/LPS O-acetylase OafA/YrhL
VGLLIQSFAGWSVPGYQGVMASAQVSVSDQRVPELDGLRATAILLVVAWHYLGIPDGSQSIAGRFFVFGRGGVDLFFALSGYLITRILLEHKDSPNYFSTFYGRRSFRILPIYGVLVGAWLVSKIGRMNAGDLPWWSYIFGIQNFWMVIQQTYGANSLAGTWSVAVEEQFYLLFPLIVRYARPAALPRLLLSLLVLCPIARIISYSLGDQFGYYVLMPLRADILAAGALVAWLQTSGSITAQIEKAYRSVFWVAVFLFPAFVVLIGRNIDFHMAYWGHTYLVALFGSTVFMVARYQGSEQLTFLRTPAAEFFARISYALYLIHMDVHGAIFGAFGSPRTIATPQGVALTALAFLVSIGICAASYRYFEKPLIKRGHRKFNYLAPATKSSQNVADPLLLRS